MPIELQAKLLTFLEGRAFRRSAPPASSRVTLRVVAATNADLAAAVRRGEFREDLFYRLNVASQLLPPLRAIRSDIPEIAATS
jgi:transcriptional regulator with PAS, ATPase and Fis domain